MARIISCQILKAKTIDNMEQQIDALVQCPPPA